MQALFFKTTNLVDIRLYTNPQYSVSRFDNMRDTLEQCQIAYTVPALPAADLSTTSVENEHYKADDVELRRFCVFYRNDNETLNRGTRLTYATIDSVVPIPQPISHKGDAHALPYTRLEYECR
jgi:hypothetical protein